MESVPYPSNYKNLFKHNFIEKVLEHYISLDLLNLQNDDVLIDVAADQSYFAEYVSGKYGIEAYRQDIKYKKGISVSKGSSVPLIGGNASFLPFRDDYVSAITLHCSFEHFEGDSDSCFMKEAARILRPGGRICILPLYLDQQYYYITDTKFYDDNYPLDSDVYGISGYGNSPTRVYSPAKLHERVVKWANGMNLTIYQIDNLDEIHRELYQNGLLYCWFAALFTREDRH